PAPWVVGSPTVLLGNMPALNNTSTLMCMWAGVITVLQPGQFTEMIP
nr:PAAR-like protein [Candidatus Competibacter phosphatis]